MLQNNENERDEENNYHSLPPADHVKESTYPYVQMENTVSPREEPEAVRASPSMPSVSSELTVDAVTDPVGFVIVCAVVLLGDMSRGVMFPTLWPLIESLGGSAIAQGYAVAAFSFGRFIMAPLFGSWSIEYGYTRTLFVSMSILCFGTILYAQAPNVGHTSFLILAQITMGVGSATLGVTRAFVADVTPHRNRTKYMSWLTAVQFSGFTVTPLVGAAISSFFANDKHVIHVGIFLVNAYTAPAYFMAILCIIILFLMSKYFRGRKRDPADTAKRMKRTPSDVRDFSVTRTCFNYLSTYEAALVACMFLNVISKGGISVFETLGVVIAGTHFNVANDNAGYFVGVCGILGVVSLLSMGKLARYLTDIQMTVFGLVVMGIGMLNLINLSELEENATWRYCMAILMVYSIGYPIGHTAVIGLFSKIVGRRPQGTLQGMFASAGSFARIFFPISSGYLVHFTGTTVLFCMLIFIIAFTIIFALYYKKTLEKLSC